MAKATDIQVGTTGHRIYREPIDAESVLFSYSDLQDRITMLDTCHTIKGRLYSGAFTSVINDNNEDNNGPYYISYNIVNDAGTDRLSYIAHKIVTDDNIKSIIFEWGTLE